MHTYTIRHLAAVIAGSTSLLHVNAFAAAASTASVTGDALETIVITGSRIPVPAEASASPVFVLSGKQLEVQGFTTVDAALKSVNQMTAGLQDEQYVEGFTPNANAVDLRGLGPGRTLILLDGRRITDYPLPYNGESNFVNVDQIPMAAVERIEILSGGTSAIYGSDAVAGVINIITHKAIDTPADVTVRLGTTTQGGGQSARLQAVGGFGTDAFKFTYAAEYLFRDPIYGFERDFMDSVADNPVPAEQIAPRAALRSDPFDTDGDGFDYVDPGSGTCVAMGFEYSFRPGRGYYCGQSNYDAQRTIRNGRQQGSLFTNASLDLGEAELFGSLNYFRNKSELDDGFSFWSPDYVYNDATGTYESLQRFFLPSEQGGRDARLARYWETSWNLAAGMRGPITGSWKYETTLSHSRYNVDYKVRRLLTAELEDYFFGPSTGTESTYGFPSYANIRFDRFYSPVTPEVYNQLSAVQHDQADSSNSNVTAVLTGELLQLPAGALTMAAVTEFGTQKYSIDVDPRLAAGEFWGITGTGGGGERDRYAAGIELSIPIVEQVRASLAGRYDKYDDVTQLDDKLTYKAGLTFRPTEALLLRGSLATSFRAPDMHYVFADPSGFFDSATDQYRCRRDQPNTPLISCTLDEANFQGTTQGNRDLKEEEGKSFTLGVAFAPTQDVSMSIDYYQIDLDGVVVDYPVERILRTEANCRLGQTSDGTPVDANSAECRDALARVQRNPADGTPTAEQITGIVTGPINASNYYTNGFDVNLSIGFPRTAFGKFGLDASYTHVLQYEIQDFAGDPVKNHRDSPEQFSSPDLRSHVRASLSWALQPIESTLFMERVGSTPKWDRSGRIAPQVYFNWSATYWLLENKASVGLQVNNVFDRNPPRDSSYDEYPYYSTFNYSAIGREAFLTLRYRFD